MYAFFEKKFKFFLLNSLIMQLIEFNVGFVLNLFSKSVIKGLKTKSKHLIVEHSS